MDKWPAIIAATLLALLPWHVILSRTTAEYITAACIFIVGIFVMYVSIEKNKIGYYIVGFILILCTYFLYPTQRIIVPLSLLPLLFFSVTKKIKIIIIVSIVCSVLITGYISSTDWGRGRFDQTSVFTFNHFIEGKSLQYATGLGQNHVLSARIFHNKLILVTMEILRQYTSYFSPQFFYDDIGLPTRYRLFEHGIGLYTLLVIGASAVILQFAFPLTAQQLNSLFVVGRKRFWIATLWLIIIGPIPAALTLDGVPNVHRSALLGIVLMYVIAGAVALLRQNVPIGRKYVLPFICILFISESVVFLHYYFSLASLTTTPFRSDEQNNLATWLNTNQNQYQSIFLPNSEAIALHYLFYKGDHSNKYSSEFSLGAKISHIDSLYFIEDKCPEKNEFVMSKILYDRNTILISRAECDTQVNFPNLTQIAKIQHYNGTDAYKIFTFDYENISRQKDI